MLELPESLHVLVARHFQAAKQSKSLIFSATELALIRTGRGVPVSEQILSEPITDDSEVPTTLLSSFS